MRAWALRMLAPRPISLSQAGNTFPKMAQKEALSKLVPETRPWGNVCSGHCCHGAVA